MYMATRAAAGRASSALVHRPALVRALRLPHLQPLQALAQLRHLHPQALEQALHRLEKYLLVAEVVQVSLLSVSLLSRTSSLYHHFIFRER